MIEDIIKANPKITIKQIADLLGRDRKAFSTWASKHNLMNRKYQIRRPIQAMGLAGEIFVALGQKRLTGTQVAHQLKIDYSRLRRWRLGEVSPPLFEAELMAQMAGYKLIMVPDGSTRTRHTPPQEPQHRHRCGAHQDAEEYTRDEARSAAHSPYSRASDRQDGPAG